MSWIRTHGFTVKRNGMSRNEYEMDGCVKNTKKQYER